MIFIELPLFSKYASFTDEELRGIQATLLQNPLAGPLIPGGRGLRKLRASLDGRGKRGGARVIYYWWHSQECCYLVFAYRKNEMENLTPDQLKQLATIMDGVIDNG
ncbi:MAG TPA: type II toxin-antitoxin system RelE/ParE family toxin [Gallionella sp.]|nr:type II toxin-antitoxin system RelE/ParE family toxin [Gallionella sp.]